MPASHDGIGAGVSAEGTGVPADAAAVKILSASPQGLTGEEWEHRNLYQSGYFKVSGEIYGSCELGEFRLWDAGFDFYAPQTFGAEDGRRILIGWMGMPDDPTYGNDPTVAEGWQHCLTLPREITVGEDGVVRQAPVRELKNLRGMRRTAESALKLDEVSEAFDIEIDGIDAEFSVTLGGELSISWRAERDGTPARLEMRFAHTGRSSSGCGRTARWERLDRVDNVRIVADTSSVEVFANDGELAMTTRWYPARRTCEIAARTRGFAVGSLCNVFLNTRKAVGFDCEERVAMKKLLGALEMGGTKMVCAIGYADGTVAERARFDTADPVTTLAACASWFAEREIAALGVGAFGPTVVDPASPRYGCMLKTPKPNWSDFDILGTLHEQLDVPMGYDTDVNVACLGEATFGCARGLQDVVYLTIGTGVGAGVLSSGSLIHGAMHPEAGHIPLVRDAADPLPAGGVRLPLSSQLFRRARMRAVAVEALGRPSCCRRGA